MSSERKERITHVRTILETLSRRSYSTESLQTIVDLFNEIPIAVLAASVPRILREFSEMPSLSDLIESIQSGQLRKIEVVQVEGKWDSVFEELENHEIGDFGNSRR